MLTAGVLTLVLALGGPVATSFADDAEQATAPTPTEVVEPAPVAPAAAQPEEPRPGSDEPAGVLEPAPSAAEQPDLKITAAFDKQIYNVGEQIRVKVTIANVGNAVAEWVTFRELTYPEYVQRRLVFDAPGWGDLVYRPGGTSVRIEPGASLVLDLVGKPAVAGSPEVQLAGSVEGMRSDANPDDNRFDISARIAGGRGSIAGVIYVDRNGNGQPDAGEGLAGVSISLGSRDQPFSGKTDDEGKFSFRDIPSATYYANYWSPDGWVVAVPWPNIGESLTVADGAELSVVRKAVRPLKETLQASLEFDKTAYRTGERAGIKIVLTNTGPADLTGITGFCRDFIGRDPSWGELNYQRAGVRIAAGATAVFEVTELVPEDKHGYGIFTATCEFGNLNVHPSSGRPQGRDQARLLGAVGTAQGIVLHDPDGEWPYYGDGVPNVEFALVDPYSGDEVVRTVTGAGGRFEVKDVAVGEYRLVLTGPWKLVGVDPLTIRVYRDYAIDHTIPVAPKPETPTPPAPPVQGGGAAAAPAAADDDELASTGASVIGLSILGIGALLAGTGALLATRRRSAAAHI